MKRILILMIFLICLLFISCTKESNIIKENNELTIEEILDNKTPDNSETSNTVENSLLPQNLKFDKHGPVEEKSVKFNSNTGDVLYVASNIYPPYKQEENNPNDYDFLSEGYGKIEQKYDETEKFLYLRNTYTNEMYLVEKLDPNINQSYSYNFTKDNKIVINDKIIENNIKTQENLVYVEYDLTKTDNSNKSNTALKIDEEVANKLSTYIKNNYNIDSEILKTIAYNNVIYAVVKIPNYYIDFDNTYKKGDSTLELWKYEDGICKRLLYNHINFSIYNMVSNEGCIMILGREGHPGYYVKLDKNSDILYETKFQGYSKSPDDRYTLFYNRDESFSVIENDKLIVNYNLIGNDDINTFWQFNNGFYSFGPYWWDLELNKLYIILTWNLTSTVNLYCVNLESGKVEDYGDIRYRPWLTELNKDLSYICTENSIFTGDAIGFYENLYINRKYSNYVYNLRTNEKIHLTDFVIFNSMKANNNLITFTQGLDNGDPIEVTIDISLYVNANRINYVQKIKKFIIESYNGDVSFNNIELCLIFNTKHGQYQIVKINKANKDSYYELWKIDNDTYIRVIEKVDNMFLTNNQEYLCTTSKDGELKVYDNSFTCTMNENIYSEELLSRYNLESLEIAHYYVMKFDKNVIFTIKSENNLAEVVNVNIINKKVSSIGYELGCNYDNFFINPKDGYMVYQKGPSLIRINENSNKKEIKFSDFQQTLFSVNLMTMEEKIITTEELPIYLGARGF